MNSSIEHSIHAYSALLTCSNNVKQNRLDMVSGRSREKSQISRDFQGQIRGKNGRFRGNFAGVFEVSFAEKMIGKEEEQILLESDWFCADLRKVFKETIRSYSIYSGFIPQYEIVLYK